MAQNRSPALPFVAAPERPIEMPFDDVHLRIEDAIEILSVPRVLHACRNAFNHLRKAWVSSFRAITAEEEAATAAIRALRHLA